MTRSVWKALPDVCEALLDFREWSGGSHGSSRGPIGCLGVVGRPSRKFGRPSRMSGSGLETLPDVPEGWESFWMSCRCREALSDVREALPEVRETPQMPRSFRKALPFLSDVREWSGDPPGCPGVVGLPSQMSRSGREALSEVREAHLDVQECSEGPPGPLGCPGVVGRPCRMSGSGREALLDVRESLFDFQEWSGGSQGCSGVFGRPSRMSVRPTRMPGSGRKTLPDVREWSGNPPRCPRVVG